MSCTGTKISVIVAVYNAEKYLHRCIDSILNQTFTEFELILVNDGSSDLSGRICDNYVLADNRVKVMHKPNGGVSSARQIGLENARGGYLIYVDSDDWVENDYLEKLYASVVTDNSDMAICDYHEDYPGITRTVSCRPASEYSGDLIKDVFFGYPCFCLNKLVRRSIYTENSISFPLDISIGEDMYVFVAQCMAGMKVSYVAAPLYHYCVNANSLSTSFSIKNFYDTQRMLDSFRGLMKGHKYLGLCENYITRRIVSRSFYNRLFTSVEFRRNLYVYRNFIARNSSIGIFKRVMFYLSCIGLYAPMYNLNKLISLWNQTTRG